MKTTAFLAVLSSMWLVGACTTIPVDERAAVRAEINATVDQTIADMTSRDPEFQKEIDAAAGYFVSRVSATKIPIFGAGYGIGVLVDKESGSRTYMNIKRTDLGAGLGATKFRVLILLENRDVLEEFRSGIWKSGLSAETAAGKQYAGRYTISQKGYSVHVASDAGAALVLSAYVATLSVNDDLTGSGVSEISVPNTGYDTVDNTGEDAPRIWDRKMPFLAQKVLDEGYDLPLPYGIALAYVNIEQELLLGGLEVGINGADLEEFDFVSFENGVAGNDTIQLKFDTWVFPFMNVFALLGKLDGDAPLDVVIDGNGALDHLGLDCSGVITPPLCGPLEDQTFVLSIEAPYSGITYSIGTILAGGWNNWFVTIPLSWTYADMDRTETEGIAFTVTPRFGRVINLGRNGNLALFAGATYMDTDLTITGSITALDGALTIDYKVDQVNKDPWNALLGFNWDINKKLSWAAEYNGFVGSRDAFITSVNWRF